MKWFTLGDYVFRLRAVLVVYQVLKQQGRNGGDDSWHVSAATAYTTVSHYYKTEEEAIAVRRALLDALEADTGDDT